MLDRMHKDICHLGTALAQEEGAGPGKDDRCGLHFVFLAGRILMGPLSLA